MITIERKAIDFAVILKSLNYRKRKVYVSACESVTLQDLNWSGGTRNTYTAFRLDGEALGNSAHYSAIAPWENFAEGAQVPLPAGSVLVRHGHFCGKESTATIYVNPSNMPRALSQEVQS